MFTNNTLQMFPVSEFIPNINDTQSINFYHSNILNFSSLQNEFVKVDINDLIRNKQIQLSNDANNVYTKTCHKILCDNDTTVNDWNNTITTSKEVQAKQNKNAENNRKYRARQRLNLNELQIKELKKKEADRKKKKEK